MAPAVYVFKRSLLTQYFIFINAFPGFRVHISDFIEKPKETIKAKALN